MKMFTDKGRYKEKEENGYARCFIWSWEQHSVSVCMCSREREREREKERERRRETERKSGEFCLCPRLVFLVCSGTVIDVLPSDKQRK